MPEILETTAAALETTLPAVEPMEVPFDITSIKGALDGFDPAALLPDLENLLRSLPGLCRLAVLVGPVLLLLLGLSYLFLSPKEANYYFGYRCYFGMGSVHAWRFSQHLSGMLFTAGGLILTVVMLIVTADFGKLAIVEMLWKAIRCLFWEAIVALLLTLAVNTSAAYFFDRQGAPRKRKKKNT